ncbi:DUF2079 domain-containing protein [Candidatus Uhrbacteria bacterium]|nr:DUF2079 domain-containing protein [Candidatus Uhrbacteria bacterium]
MSPEGNSGTLSHTPLLLALLWLANPLVHNINLFEFHILPFALPFLFLAILAYEKKQMARFVLWSLIALTVREDVSLTVGAFALLATIDVLRKKRSWQWIDVPLFLSASWFILAQKIATVYAVGGSYKFLVYYAWLGDSFPNLITNMFLHPLTVLAHVATGNTLLFMLALGIPFLFLFFVRPRYLVLTLPIVAQHLLATYGGDPLIAETHYVTLLLPGLVLATMATLLHPPRFAHPQLLRILLIVATLYSATTTLGPLYGIVTERVSATEQRERNYFIAQIPPDASVATTESFLTPLSRRNAVYLLRYVFSGETQYGKAPYTLPESAEYILMDMNDLIAYKTGDADALRTTIKSFGVIVANGQFVLLKRGSGTPLIAPDTEQLSAVSATIRQEQPCSVPPLLTCTHLILTSKNAGAVVILRSPDGAPLLLPIAYSMGNDTQTRAHYWLPENKNISIATGDATHTLVLANDRAVEYRHTITNERFLSANEAEQSQ